MSESLFLRVMLPLCSKRTVGKMNWNQFSSRCARKCPYALHTVSQKRFQCSSGDDGPLSSFQGRSSRASSFKASHLHAINGVMSLALCPQVVSQASQHFRSSEKQTPERADLPASLSARSFPLTPACPGQYTHRSF